MSKIAATILADSVGPHGVRLTTVELTFPRLALADLTRHRALSFSIESSRARPTEAIIDQVRNDPYIPTFLKRERGMGGGPPLTGLAQRRAQWRWVNAAHEAARTADRLQHTSKQHVNRLLEPFMWTTAVISATDWENFLKLREHPAAQPELQIMARVIRQVLEISMPRMVEYGQWHLPLVSYMDYTLGALYKPNEVRAIDGAFVSAGRCARTSFKRHADAEPMKDSIRRWTEKLAPNAHWSPAEHPAVCVEPSGVIDTGNFAAGWRQLRKFYPNEAVFRG